MASPLEWMKQAISDLIAGCTHWRIWTTLAWVGVKSRYSRSALGFLWITISFAVFIAVKLIIFGSLFGRERGDYFALYLTCGFFVWQVASSSINSATRVFTSSQGFIKNDALPLSIYAFQDVARELTDMAFTVLVVLGVFLVIRPELTQVAFLSAAAIIAVMINMVWVKLFLGVLATRYRDVRHTVQTIMRVMFFLTPIFWMPDQIGAAINILWWNPLFHFLEIFRAPLIDDSPAVTSWIFVSVVTLTGWIAALLVYGRFRHRVVFWL